MVDLKEGWHIYKIVEPAILSAVAFLALAFSVLAIAKSLKNLWEVVQNEETG